MMSADKSHLLHFHASLKKKWLKDLLWGKGNESNILRFRRKVGMQSDPWYACGVGGIQGEKQILLSFPLQQVINAQCCGI